MTTTNQKPIIFLAFANDHSNEKRYLRSLPDEQRQLHDILEQVEDEGLCKLEEAPFATIKEILDMFQKHRDQIAVFHFAGHSNSYELLFEAAGGEVEVANAGGLATFLGEQKGLRLVFLNGCSNREQVQGLLEANIPAVIATSQDILDPVAMDFASRFYKGLATKAPIRTAYNEARASVESRLKDDQSRGALRRKQAAPSDQWPWDLYLQEGDETADQWSLITPIITQPRLPEVEPETIYIPGGEFWLGSDADEEGARKYEQLRHRLFLPAYSIGKYPVTNWQYRFFVKEKNWPAPKIGWEGQHPAKDKQNHPVMGVTWLDAVAYCKWLSEKTERPYRLPSEAEWEKAAKGKIDAHPYPWGEWQDGRCNFGTDEATTVDAFEEQSDYGCFDMVGNVPEWTSSLWGKELSPAKEFYYPWEENPDRDDLTAGNQYYRVYRGGFYGDRNVTKLRCASRQGHAPDSTGELEKQLGFRVVLDIEGGKRA